MAGADPFFEALAQATEPAAEEAPNRVQSRVYSALMRAAEAEGPLCTLAESKDAGHGLCVFEELVRITPLGEKPQRFNYCRICHARVLAETVENAPIYWPHCPYVRFQGR